MTIHDDNWRRANELLAGLRTVRGTGARAELLFQALQIAADAARKELFERLRKDANYGDEALWIECLAKEYGL